MLYIGLSVRLIQARVGYQYDEALFVESAAFMVHGIGTPPSRDYARWTRDHGRRWPLMIIPYEGTTKAVVALPIFALFGISPETARACAVLLGCVGLAGFVTLLGLEIGAAAGLVVGTLLAIHPTFLDLTVFDNSGVSVWMAAMGLLALALTNHINRRTKRSALWLGIAAGLGVWARANLVWLLASVIAAALFAFGRRAIPRRDHILAMVLGGFCGAFPLILYEAGSRLGTLRYIAEAGVPLSVSRVADRLRALAELMISDGEQRGIWAGPPLPSWQLALGAAMMTAVVLGLWIRAGGGDPGIARWRRAFAAATVVLTGFLLGSRLRVVPHHLVAILPLALASLAILSVELWRFRFARPLLATAAVLLVALFLRWDVRMDHGLHQSGGNGFWSSAVDEAREHLRAHPVPPDRLKILNWGLRNNLFVGSGGAVYGSELFWGATRDRSSRGLDWESEIRDGGSFLLYLVPTGSADLDAASKGFSRALADYRGPRRETRFLDRSGSPVALLVEIPAAR